MKREIENIKFKAAKEKIPNNLNAGFSHELKLVSLPKRKSYN